MFVYNGSIIIAVLLLLAKTKYIYKFSVITIEKSIFKMQSLVGFLGMQWLIPTVEGDLVTQVSGPRWKCLQWARERQNWTIEKTEEDESRFLLDQVPPQIRAVLAAHDIRQVILI